MYAGNCEANPGDDIAIVEKADVTGKVIDEQAKGVKGVRIRVKSLMPCLAYGVETVTNEQGEFRLTNAPANRQLEIEVSYTHQASAFYQTRLHTNKQGDPHINYFPFRVKRQDAVDCIALAPSPLDVSGKISFAQANVPSGSEALVRLKSLDGCSSYDKAVVTENQAYLMTVSTLGSLGQLTVSLAGRATEVLEVPIKNNKQGLPQVNVHDVSLSTPQVWPELNPIWTPESGFYPGSKSLEQ